MTEDDRRSIYKALVMQPFWTDLLLDLISFAGATEVMGQKLGRLEMVSHILESALSPKEEDD